MSKKKYDRADYTPELDFAPAGPICPSLGGNAGPEGVK
jgi:hypothetical protein